MYVCMYMLNDIFLSILMFADDVFLLSSSANSLRKHLSSLQTFCHKWSLRINTEKTKICIFGNNHDKLPFFWEGIPLERVSAYKYLGVWITSNGEFRTAKRHLSNQGKKAVFFPLNQHSPSCTILQSQWL